MTMSDGIYTLRYYRILYNLPVTKVWYLYGNNWKKLIGKGVKEDKDFDDKIVSKYEFDMKTRVLNVWLVGKEDDKERVDVVGGDTVVSDGENCAIVGETEEVVNG